MARKQFNYIVTPASVLIQKLSYAGDDAPAEVAETQEFMVADIPAELNNGEALISLAAYGLSQVLQDRASSVDTEDKMEQMGKTFENLKEGLWKEARVSNGSVKKASIDPFFAAGFSEYLASQGKDVDANACTILLQGYSAEQRKALRTHADIKVFIEQAKEKATAQVADLDLSSLLG